jgi:hypothetical protein
MSDTEHGREINQWNRQEQKIACRNEFLIILVYIQK